MINDIYGYAVDGAGNYMVEIGQFGLTIAVGALFFAVLILYNGRKAKTE